MKLKRGDIISVNLICGCTKMHVGITKGEQDVECPQCHKKTNVKFKVARNTGELNKMIIKG